MASPGTVSGLLLLSAVSLGEAVTTTEATVWYCRTTVQPLWVRCLGYTPPTVFSLAVAGCNTLLLLPPGVPTEPRLHAGSHPGTTPLSR